MDPDNPLGGDPAGIGAGEMDHHPVVDAWPSPLSHEDLDGIVTDVMGGVVEGAVAIEAVES